MLKGKSVINQGQAELLKVVGSVRDSKHLYLAGGTALAEFYLGHRRSFDLDIFTSEEKLIKPFSNAFEKAVKKSAIQCKVIKRFASFVEYEVGSGRDAFRVQFALDSSFRFKEPASSEYGINIISYDDIIVDKLLAFFGRAEQRDAVDLYFILQKEPLDKLVKKAKKKDPGFDMYWFGLAAGKVDKFPDDIRKWAVEMLVSADGKKIKRFFKELEVRLMDGINGGK